MSNNENKNNRLPFGLTTKQLWSFVLGAGIGSAIAVIAYIMLVYSNINITKEWYLLYPTGFVFSGTLGFYLSSLWGEKKETALFLFGFLIVPMFFVLATLARGVLAIFIAIGFVIGFALVQSGAISRNVNIWKVINGFYKKGSWYFFGTTFTATNTIISKNSHI